MKKALDVYKDVCYLQEEFILHHEKRDGIARITYSDGSMMTVNYNEKSSEITKNGERIWSLNFN